MNKALRVKKNNIMKTLTGKVIKNTMEKTTVVLVERMWQHPMYKKRVKRSKKYLVHTDKKVNIEDKVLIGETKPISKKKTWKVIEVLKK
jgi:small subunit ribosomal protein S17